MGGHLTYSGAMVISPLRFAVAPPITPPPRRSILAKFWHPLAQLKEARSYEQRLGCT